MTLMYRYTMSTDDFLYMMDFMKYIFIGVLLLISTETLTMYIHRRGILKINKVREMFTKFIKK